MMGGAPDEADLPEQEADPSQQEDSSQDGAHEDPQRHAASRPSSSVWGHEELHLQTAEEESAGGAEVQEQLAAVDYRRAFRVHVDGRLVGPQPQSGSAANRQGGGVAGVLKETSMRTCFDFRESVLPAHEHAGPGSE